MALDSLVDENCHVSLQTFIGYELSPWPLCDGEVFAYIGTAFMELLKY